MTTAACTSIVDDERIVYSTMQELARLDVVEPTDNGQALSDGDL
jgi:hypothetical protein